jgi:hypothetical protein
MKYALLQRTHPDVCLDDLRRDQDLFEGGKAFRARIDRYLLQNEQEPAPLFRKRCQRAYYLNYIARIVRFFAGALFAKSLTRTSDPSADEWYRDVFEADADGAGTDLDVMVQQSFVRALVGRRAYVRVEVAAASAEGPAPTSLADADRMGLRRVRLVPVATEDVRHWKRAADGTFLWVTEYASTTELEDFEDPEAVTTETWTTWYADGTARRWQIRHPAGQAVRPATVVPEIDPPANPGGAVPLVELALPPELHLLAHVADPALEAFRKASALSWAVDRTCYAMPAFFLKDKRKPPTMGAGYYLMLGIGEKVEWPSPESAPFEVVQKLVQSIVQEIHRVVEQMALAVDNNAAAAVGRSGESKTADGAATQIVLPSFGKHVRDFEERVLDRASLARGDGLTWAVQGMDRFDVADVGAVVDAALASDPLLIPSVTHRRAVMKGVSRALLPTATEEQRAQIDREIDAGVNAEDTDPPRVPPIGSRPGAGADPNLQP